MLPKWYTPPHLRKQRRLPSAKVLEAVSEVFDVSICDIKSNLRHKKFSRPRQVACYMMKRHCEHLSYPMIAKAVGRSDHTTAMHSIAVVDNLLRRDDELARRVSRVNAMLNGEQRGKPI